ncbi:peptidylprolyl isomerase [Enemella sp. A6]|uniref:peptidylprolyl isomerase n=1 Tax=Enemella sp. A6 TaxID=3440152 RepID=UPI003EBBDB36
MSMMRTLPFFAAATLALTACAVAPETQKPETPAPEASEPAGETEPSTEQTGQAGETVDCEYPPDGEPAKPVDAPETTGVPASGEATFTIETNEGNVVITMDRAKAPCTVNSFESLATQGYFDGTTCHRLVDSGIFVLQCGDPTGTGTGGPGYSFADETDPSDTFPAGTVAMANAGPNTNGSQFFLVYEDTELPPNYTVFGTMDQDSIGVVNRIAAEGQDGTSPGGGGKPNNPAEIKKVSAG